MILVMLAVLVMILVQIGARKAATLAAGRLATEAQLEQINEAALVFPIEESVEDGVDAAV